MHRMLFDNGVERCSRNQVRTFLYSPRSAGYELLPQAGAVYKLDPGFAAMARLQRLHPNKLDLADVETPAFRRSKVVIGTPMNGRVRSSSARRFRQQRYRCDDVNRWAVIGVEEIRE